MTKRNIFRRLLVVLGVVAIAEAAGVSQTPAHVAVYSIAKPAARQDSAAVQSGGVVQTGRLVKMATPIYPPAAIQARISGVVTIDARIGADGRVIAVEVVSGPPALRGVAEYAVKHWEYEPSLLNGKPVERDAQVGLHFILGRR